MDAKRDPFIAHCPPSEAVLGQLARIERSAAFAGSDRLLELLRFLTEETLAGRGATLKEVVIGNAVYKRDPPYDPRIDSTVRVEARRLRSKLDEHYAGAGGSDPVLIALPTGRYVPVFSARSNATRSETGANPKPVFESGRGAALAVLPLLALSRTSEDEAFAAGLTEEIAYALSHLRGMRVVRGPTAVDRGGSGSLADIARSLGVDAVLHGSVRGDADAVRVTIEATDPQGFIVLSDRLDASRADPLRTQERIAATVLSRLDFDSSLMRAQQIAPGPFALSARGKIYKARRLLDLQSPDALQNALALFDEVARAAPDYARGQAGVADCQCDLYRVGLAGREAAGERARAAAGRALEIDPGSIEALSARATVAAWFDRDVDRAEADYLAALERGPNARAARLYAMLLSAVGRDDEAAERFADARAIEPFSERQDVAEALALFQRRRFGELLDAVSLLGVERAPPEARLYAAFAAALDGSADRARLLGADAHKALGRRPDLAFAGAELDALLGDRRRAERLIEEPPGRETWFARAALAAALGRVGTAIDALERSVAEGEFAAVWIGSDPRFDALRADERFAALGRTMGAPEPAPHR